MRRNIDLKQIISDVIAGILAALVVFSLVAVFIDVWWEKRKRRKNKGG